MKTRLFVRTIKVLLHSTPSGHGRGAGHDSGLPPKAAGRTQRFFCVMQHDSLRTFLDASCNLCVNTWTLTHKSVVEQLTEFTNDGGG
jgi:hypothetical protein